MFEYKNEYLFWNGFNLSGLDLKSGSPLHVINRSAVEESAAQFLKPFYDEKLPVSCHFSVKTNPVPELLLLLKQLNINMEVISPYELWLLENLGINGSSVIVNGAGKTKDFLWLAHRKNVKLISIWSPNELEITAGLIKNDTNPWNISLRICPRLSSGLFKLSLNGSAAGSAHGFSINKSELRPLFKLIKKNPSLNFKGLHFHLGSGIKNIRAYIEALSVLEEIIIYAGHRGLSSSIMNIGGGFGSSDAPLFNLPSLISSVYFKKNSVKVSKVKPLLLNELAKEIGRTLIRLHKSGVYIDELIIEPGRIISGSAQITILTVLDIIQRKKHGTTVICSGGAMSLSPMLLTEHHRILPLIRRSNKLVKYSLYGNLPSSLDMISASQMLPPLNVGDKLALLDTGAYFIPFSNNFAGPRPAVILIEGNRSKIIRKSEENTDMIRHDLYFTKNECGKIYEY